MELKENIIVGVSGKFSGNIVGTLKRVHEDEAKILRANGIKVLESNDPKGEIAYLIEDNKETAEMIAQI